MKNIKFFIIAILIVSSNNLFSQNFELSTLRIGDFHLNMNKDEFQKLTGLQQLGEDVDYENPPIFDYNGTAISVVYYYSDDDYFSIDRISTKSKKFRTKSGMGVGNTRYELLASYKDFPSFEMIQGWDWDEKTETGNYSKTDSYFYLYDNEASSYISFKMVNNIVVEISVGTNEGC